MCKRHVSVALETAASRPQEAAVIIFSSGGNRGFDPRNEDIRIVTDIEPAKIGARADHALHDQRGP